MFGVENENSRFRSVSPSASLSVPIPDPARGKAEITSVYGQLNAEPITGLTLTGGLRYDDHNRYGGRTLFSAGGVWALPTGTVVTSPVRPVPLKCSTSAFRSPSVPHSDSP